MKAVFLLPAVLLCLATRSLAAQPIVEKVRIEVDGTRSLSHEIVVDAPRQQVWTAISTAEGWTSWAVPTAFLVPGTTDRLETSYSLTARPGDPGNIISQFVARLPGRLLVFRTIKAPEGFSGFEALRRVTQFLELSDAGAGRTRVRLTGVDYPATVVGSATFDFFRKGNRLTLEMLRDRFETGPIDWKKRLARPDNRGS